MLWCGAYPQFSESGLIKYGAVKVVSHCIVLASHQYYLHSNSFLNGKRTAPRKPIAAAKPNVYDRRRCDGSSPPDTHA